jgi:hypothetical protein
MKTLMYILRPLYLGVILFTIFSCATAQILSQEGKEQIIDMGSYTVAAPSGDKWKVEPDKAKGKVQFTKQEGSLFGGGLPLNLIHVSYNVVLKQEMWKLSTEEIATHYRDGEVIDMQMRGMLPGNYELHDVKKGVATVDEKTLYTLSYKQTGGKWFGRDKMNEAVLYLYFPPNFHESHRFYLFHISQVNTRDAQATLDVKSIAEVIGSFRLK